MMCHQKLDSKTSQCFWDSVAVGGWEAGLFDGSDTSSPPRTRLSWINVLALFMWLVEPTIPLSWGRVSTWCWFGLFRCT